VARPRRLTAIELSTVQHVFRNNRTAVFLDAPSPFDALRSALK
jgi:hypothetical protein